MQLGYRPEIDGLRALAVIPVILYHANFAFFSGGFVGVDVFFVISGYLIASIILAEMREQRFSFASFYERRIRRIMPALLTVVITTLLLLPLVALPDQLIDAAKSALFAIFGVSNFFFWHESGYFSPATEFMPFLHSWSLGVEEQFYIFLPPILLLLLRFKINLRWAIGLALPLMFAVSVWMSANMASAAFYLLPARAWELGLGVALAAGVFPAVRNPGFASLLAWTGIVAILLSTVLINDTMMFPGWVALLPCVGTALLIHAGSNTNSAGKFLSLSWLRYVGLLSYSLYLWHWPVFVLLRYITASAHLSVEMALLGIAVSFALSAATYHFIETPFRSRTKMPFKTVGKYVGGATAVAGIIATSVIVLQGMPNRLNERSKTLLAVAQDIDPLRLQCLGTGTMDLSGGPCRFGDPDAPISFVLVGDSHAAAIRPAVEQWALGARRAGVLTWRGACPLLKGARKSPDADARQCTEFKDAFFDQLGSASTIKDVFLGGRWGAAYSGYRPESGGSFRNYLIDSVEDEHDLQTSARVFERALRASVAFAEQKGIKTTIIGAMPESGFDVPRILALAEHNSVIKQARPNVDEEEQYNADALGTLFNTLAAESPNVSHISLRQEFCMPDCQLIRDGIPLYRDDDHITATAAREIVGPIIIEQMGPAQE